MTGYHWIDGIAPERTNEFFDLYRQEWWTKDRQFDDVIGMLEHCDVVIGCCAPDGKLWDSRGF